MHVFKVTFLSCGSIVTWYLPPTPGWVLLLHSFFSFASDLQGSSEKHVKMSCLMDQSPTPLCVSHFQDEISEIYPYKLVYGVWEYL